MFRRQTLLVFVAIFIVTGFVSATEILGAATNFQSAREAGNFWPPDQRLAVGGPKQAESGEWYMLGGEQVRTPDEDRSHHSSGGPDEFGYVWDDSAALNWIDASGGDNTGVTGDNPASGPIQLGFPFKFYENTYSQLYVSLYGFVSFNGRDLFESQSNIPDISEPNDVIAPHWAPHQGVYGYVRYLRGGSAPNRWFVVEWNRLDGGFDSELTFQVVLQENGDVLFQYKDMQYSSRWWCQASGVEDSRGSDGLTVTGYCEQIEGNHAMLINRPPAAARVRISQPYLGTFASAGQRLEYPITLYNTGEFGSDTYDLNTISSHWPIELVGEHGEALSDTDGDGVIDSGSVPQGSSVIIRALLQSPTLANVGENNVAGVTAKSSLDPSVMESAVFRAAIPTSFGQSFIDNVDGAMSFYQVMPHEQAVKKVTSDGQYGSNPAVSETPGFAYVWSKYAYLGDGVSISDIEYTILDDLGDKTRGVMKLTNHESAAIDSIDQSPVVEVAPNGNIGVSWYRYYYDDDSSKYNYNIWFALLNTGGDVIYGPVNITDNSAWGSWSGNDILQYFQPRIVATENNRWILAFQRYIREDGSDSSNIYYALRNSDGSSSLPPTRFTNGTQNEYYSDPSLTSLKNNRALLAYSHNRRIVYVVLDSMGNTVKGESSFGSEDYDPDGVQLSNGRILLAWSNWDRRDVSFLLLDGDSYDIVAGPTTLKNPAARSGDDNVSVTRDNAGNGILTWMDRDRHNLYYALVDSDGQVETKPTIFRQAQLSPWGGPNISSSFEGYGNTSYTIAPTSDGVDTTISGPNLVGAAPEGAADFPLKIGNLGQAEATSVRVTAMLPSGITYERDNSGITPVQDGNKLTWTFGKELDFLGHGQFTLYLRVPDAPVGTRYSVQIMVEADQSEADEGNNLATVKIMIARQLFLPVIMR